MGMNTAAERRIRCQRRNERHEGIEYGEIRLDGQR
jgi:hypothetical protein